jgi:hypothetical protein
MRFARAALAVGAVLVGAAGLVRCTTDGLDGYASGWEGGVDAGKDGASDQDGPSMDAGGGCDCGLGQACVRGTCETCVPTWSVDFPSVAGNDEAFDTRSTTLYFAGSRTVGDAGATTGYLGLVDECTGKLVRAFDAPKLQSVTLAGLNNPSIAGSKLYMRLYAQAPQAGGYARFDLASEAFDLAVPTLPSLSMGSDESWMMTAAPSGNVWWSGDMNYAPGPPTATVGKGVGAGVCWKGYTQPNESGRAITVDGTDVYVVTASTNIRVYHLDDASCAPPSCACAPSWTAPTLNLTSQTTGAMRARVVGKKLYVVGWTFVDAMGVDWKAWIAALDLGTKTWNTPFTWNPSSKIDAFVGLDADATYLYLSAAQAYDGTTWVSAASKVVVIPLTFDGQVAATVLDVPRLRVGWNIDLDRRGGFTLSGMSTDNGNDGRAIRCSLQTCPP